MAESRFSNVLIRLIEYDVTSNRTTKYKFIKEKTVPGYHPIL